MKRQLQKLLRYLLLILFIPAVSLLSQNNSGREHQQEGYVNTGQGNSLIQTFPQLPLSGRNGSFLGEEVTDLGDINGDGFDDFAVGLKEAAVYPSGLKLGKVYIYFGSSNPSSEKDPDIILTGEGDADRFGCSVATAGDVNNDGFPDVIVGAYFNSAAALLAGRAYLFFGGPGMDNVPDAVFTGEGVEDYFGFSVSSAGDVNNDGFSDVLVGSYFADRGVANAGNTFLFLGGANPDNTPDLIFSGEAGGDNFGYSVAPAGDVNNDGFSDIIIGALLNDTGSPDAGRAYIFLGGAAMDNIPDIILTGTITGGHFGTSVSSAGDVNNDGFSDVIVGYPISEVFYAGESYIYFGGTSMDNTPDVMLAGESGFDSFGFCVSTAGDVNNDGFSDVIVGATSGGLNIAGRAYLYFGGAEMDSIADVIFEGEGNQDFFGTSVSAAGDVNHDGFSDVIAGANWNDAGGIDAGRAYVYFGGTEMNNTADIIFTGEKNYDHFGCSVASAGDVNNDGFSDFIIGALSNDDKAPDAGSAYLYFGGNTIGPAPDLMFTGEEQSDDFGVSVTSAGDLNNDGFSDIVIGAYFNGRGGTLAGSAYIYFGGANMDNTADLILSGGSYENFGNSVASAGDVNNDGYSDLIIGAYTSDSSAGFESGRAYLFLGGNPMDNIPDVVFNAEGALDNFGISVASAGDLNKDGFSDIIIGAYVNDGDGADAGRAYIYFGGENMDNTADIILHAEAIRERFGTCVSSAGDVNKDGFSDVLVGAQLAGPNAEGRAYLFYGGTVMDNIPDLVFDGEALSDGFGTSVSSAGDVNNDGFTDIFIGAYFNGAGGYGSGRAYFYFGGTSPDNIPDAVFTGNASSDQFGISIASAGDVNHDGYSDMIIGATGNSAVGYEMGRAYLYAGGTVISGINNKTISAGGYNLFPSYPNPFNPETHISFELPEQSNVSLTIYNILGKEIITIEDGRLSPGHYERDWKGVDASGKLVSSGVYFYRFHAIGENGNEYSKVMKMVMVK